MTQAGDKLIEAAKEAARSARCDHSWRCLRIDTNARGDITKIVDTCDFCGCRRSRFTCTRG